LCWGSNANDFSEAGWRACGFCATYCNPSHADWDADNVDANCGGMDGTCDGYDHEYNYCKRVTEDAFDYAAMQNAISDDPDLYASMEGQDFLYHVKVNDHEEGADSNAWFSFKYGTYYRSNEEICFTGDFFPYQSPSCHLKNSGLPVATQIHNPHEYAMD